MVFFSLPKMECINLEASEGNNQLLVSFDDEDEITNDEMEDFIDDGDQQQDDVSIYRQLGPENIEHYHKFPNHTTNPKEAIYEDDEPYCGSEETHSLNCIIPKIESLLILINFMDLKNLSKNSRIP